MHAAVVRIEARVPESRSLKAKRKVLRPLVARLEAMKVAVSEIDQQDAWQAITLGVAVVAPDARHLGTVLESVKRAAYEDPRLEVVSISVSHMEES